MLTLLVSLTLCNPESREMKLLRTWHAICLVESGGDTRAIGDGGKAVGIGQIHRITVDDANRVIGWQKFSYTDRMDPVKSFEMFRLVSLYYHPQGGPEQWSRRWNGGTNWKAKPATVRYWSRVKAKM